MIQNPVEETKKTIDEIISFITLSPWKTEYLSRFTTLKENVEKPCVLAVAGRVNEGKSSFVNALLGCDLAKTGILETTATVNLFKYGIPKDPSCPVLCVWKNGKENWVSKEFLDDLQGNDERTLDKAKGIDHLEYFLGNPVLEKITLVDTPGTGAIVGDDGDGHEKKTSGYFFKNKVKCYDATELRQLHAEESVRLTDGADAVIYLVGQVAKEGNQDFLKNFQEVTGGSSSAMNALGVMSKIDFRDDILSQKDELAANISEKLKHELNTVIPVSAGIWRAMDVLIEKNELQKMQSIIKPISLDAFNYLMKSPDYYLMDGSRIAKAFKIPEDSIPDIETRKSIKSGLDWRVFVVIVSNLYKYKIDEAILRLRDICGVDRIRKILDTHFFKRGNLLRCFRIVNELMVILREIERNKIYELRRESIMKTKFESFIQTHPQYHADKNTGDKLISFVNNHLKSETETTELERKINSGLLPMVENLLLELKDVDEKFNALFLVEEKNNPFTTEERDELFALFGMYGNSKNAADVDESIKRQRQNFWNLEYRLSRNEIRRKVARTAVSFYGKI